MVIFVYVVCLVPLTLAQQPSPLLAGHLRMASDFIHKKVAMTYKFVCLNLPVTFTKIDPTIE